MPPIMGESFVVTNRQDSGVGLPYKLIKESTTPEFKSQVVTQCTQNYLERLKHHNIGSNTFVFRRVF